VAPHRKGVQVNADKLFNLLGAIVTVAMVTTVVMRGSQSAAVINAVGDAFSGSLRAAMGR
jgi:hypothetical protein